MSLIWIIFTLSCLSLVTTNLAKAASDTNIKPTSKLENLSIKDLMEVEVSSVSRKSQQLSNTAAAAFIITQEDIRRSGATNIPQALRLAPGVEVAQIGASRWAISVRGFNNQYANKLLVLMDGRTLFTPLFSGVFWDQQDTMMQDIERIEVIRGPGAVMWGSNAVNGVINIITKKTKDTRGNQVVVGGGNQEQGFIAYRHGGQVNDNGNYRVYAKTFEREAFKFTNSSTAHDDWRSAQTGFRYDQRLSNQHSFTIQGDAYRLKKGCQFQPYTLTQPFNTSFVDDCTGDGANILSRWEANFEDGSELKLQSYYDRVGFNSITTSNIQDTFDLDLQHRLHPHTNHDLMWGLNYRFVNSANENTPVFHYNPIELGFHQGSAFVQDDITLIKDTLRLTLGTKVEESHFGHTQVQPNARLLWTLNNRHSIWTSLSRASRIPSQGVATSDIAATTTTAQLGPINLPVQLMILANPNLKAEKVFTSEIGYRSQWTPKFFTDLTLFNNEYSDQIILSKGNQKIQFFPLQATQQLIWSNQQTDFTTRGIEVSSEWQLLDWMRFSGNYSHLDFENNNLKGNSPRNHGSVRWQMDLSEQIQFDNTVRYVGQLSGGGTPAYTTFDTRLAYRPIKTMELSFTVQNLFAPQHYEFNDSPVLNSAISAITVPRSFYGMLSWNF